MGFPSITGHEFQKEFLMKSIKKQRVANSYLFYGPEGVGKKLVALEFAKLLNCERKRDGQGVYDEGKCTCSSCLKIDGSNHPDVTVLKSVDSSEIKVNQIREQIEDLIYLKPYEGRYKISIIDDAESMNINAQNAFLKTLEEPPADAVIILVCSKPQYLLKTITSRCQSLEFFRLDESVIIQAIKSKSQISAEHYETAARLSQGSLSKALMMDEELLLERKSFIDNIANIQNRSAVGILELVEDISKEKSSDSNDYNVFFETLFMWLKDILYMKSNIDDKHIVHRDITEATKRFAQIWSIDYILELRSFLEKARESLFFRNVNKQFVLENVIIKFSKT